MNQLQDPVAQAVCSFRRIEALFRLYGKAKRVRLGSVRINRYDPGEFPLIFSVTKLRAGWHVEAWRMGDTTANHFGPLTADQVAVLIAEHRHD